MSLLSPFLVVDSCAYTYFIILWRSFLDQYIHPFIHILPWPGDYNSIDVIINYLSIYHVSLFLELYF